MEEESAGVCMNKGYKVLYIYMHDSRCCVLPSSQYIHIIVTIYLANHIHLSADLVNLPSSDSSLAALCSSFNNHLHGATVTYRKHVNYQPMSYSIILFGPFLFSFHYLI